MRLVLVALLAVSQAGCAARGSQFPVLAPTMNSDAVADCAALADELERVAVLRREIAREQNVAGASDATSVAVSTAFNPISGAVEGVLTAAGAGIRNNRYDRAADAADQRISRLLSLRVERGCERPDPEIALSSAFAAEAGTTTSQSREAREDAVQAFLPPPRR